MRLFPLHGRISIWATLTLLQLGTTYLQAQPLARFPICSMPATCLTLSSTGLILQSTYPQSLQRRRENVARQLALWPEALQEAQEPDIWEGLEQETRTSVIATLARLISKAVCPENLPETQEQSHER